MSPNLVVLLRDIVTLVGARQYGVRPRKRGEALRLSLEADNGSEGW